MISTAITLTLSLLGGGGVLSLVGLLVRWGLAPAFLTAIPMLVKAADFALDAAIGLGRMLGSGITTANSNPPVYVLCFATFLAGGVYFGEWQPWKVPKARATIERVERAPAATASPKRKDKQTSAFDDIRCALTNC